MWAFNRKLKLDCYAIVLVMVTIPIAIMVMIPVVPVPIPAIVMSVVPPITIVVVGVTVPSRRFPILTHVNDVGCLCCVNAGGWHRGDC
jgi:hypothetical protein